MRRSPADLGYSLYILTKSGFCGTCEDPIPCPEPVSVEWIHAPLIGDKRPERTTLGTCLIGAELKTAALELPGTMSIL